MAVNSPLDYYDILGLCTDCDAEYTTCKNDAESDHTKCVEKVEKLADAAFELIRDGARKAFTTAKQNFEKAHANDVARCHRLFGGGGDLDTWGLDSCLQLADTSLGLAVGSARKVRDVVIQGAHYLRFNEKVQGKADCKLILIGKKAGCGISKAACKLKNKLSCGCD